MSAAVGERRTVLPPELANLAITTRILVRTFSEVGEGESCVSASSLLLNRPRGRLTSCLQRRAPRQARPGCPNGSRQARWSEPKRLAAQEVEECGHHYDTVRRIGAVERAAHSCHGLLRRLRCNVRREYNEASEMLAAIPLQRCASRLSKGGAMHRSWSQISCVPFAIWHAVCEQGRSPPCRAALRAVQSYWFNTSSDEGF